MFEDEQICPYTGLRSFTEEESLYFKGREEEIDQATEQLQRNKFLMLTGASGDGKSSLIYAGIIPNARAGFLKSKYSQWCVADFRPERTPFQNLCRSIARQLDIPNVQTVHAELNHGFSAIIDLYRNSKKFIDPNSSEWLSANDAKKAALKREAANLIILVDQFEEFFTNPENYHKGVPSGDANLVLNLLLETARISLEEDLPIYVVFTMRSDYIGQCAAFRGLPEYIGFSQFFVPRLNRTQLQQVIEEPSVLSGNRITRRLTERLIHDLKEGVDQLPILQHALNQIWHAAGNGNEEMDLIHYAMVGGMPVKDLPDEHVNRFEKWFESLPEDIKACYHQPNLQNVLDTHTNKLYEEAEEYYLQKTGKTISDADAKAIIKTTFTCLTKIDQSRAVRNRMTLKEITNILGRPEFGTKEVGSVLNIFREPGNTFIRPFISEDSDSETLKETDVLDITHESLIRNWQYLEQWAKEEYDNYAVSLDFEQQLNRWVESGKSKAFLLSIGPLTYFENWFNAAKPNAYWIARYLPEDIEEDRKLLNAQQVLNNGREFLAGSANKHVVTRTIMRYGPRRIAAILGLLAVIVFSSFAVRDYLQSKNDYVLKSMKSEAFELANQKLSLEFPIPIINELLLLGELTIPEAVDAVKDPRQKIRIVNGIATQLVNQGRYEPKKEIFQSLRIADSLLQAIDFSGNNLQLSEDLKLLHDFSVTAGYARVYNQDEFIKELVVRNGKRSAKAVMHVFKTQPKGFTDMQMVTLVLEDGLSQKGFTQAEIEELLRILSPFETNARTPWIETNFRRDKVMVRGGFTYGPPYNGLYQELAYLYAASGQPGRLVQCMDSILQYSENYYQNDYATHSDNATNIAAVFYTYGTGQHLDSFVNAYCQRKNIDPVEFYNRLVSRALLDITARVNLYFYAGGSGQRFANTNLILSSDSLMAFFFSKLKGEILKMNDSAERNFHLAYILKNEANFFAFRKEARGLDNKEYDALYRESINYYQQVSREYLEQTITTVGSGGSDILSMPRKFLFLYPDYRIPFHPYETRALIQFYNSYSFIDYVLENNLFDTLYQNPDELRYFQFWLTDYHASMSSRNFWLHDQMPVSVMERLASKLEERNAVQSADLNILYLHLGNERFKLKDSSKGIAWLERIRPDRMLNAFQYKNFDFINSYSLELVGEAIAGLTLYNRFDLARKFLNVFRKEANRSSLYAYASQRLSLSKESPALAQRLLDSARVEMNRLDNPAAFQPNRHQVAKALMYIDPEKNTKEAYRTIKNSFNKFAAISRFSTAYSLQGNLYKARQQAPPLISSGDKAFFLKNIIEGYQWRQPPKKEWTKFKDNEIIFARRFLPYVNENQ